MASNEQEEMSIKAKLSKLHCPFTWEILDSVIKMATYRLNDKIYKDDHMMDEASCPLELFIKYLYKCYKSVISADNDKAEKKIEKAEEILMQIQDEQEYRKTIRAMEHIFYATKCFFLYDIENINELKDIIENIVDTEDFSNEELGALYGCQSVVWSLLRDFGVEKAIDFAKKALEKNQDCALWHFIFAKNLRRSRRSIQVSSAASDMEKEHFEIAYAMSNNKNHKFGIYYLQMRMERFYKSRLDKNDMINKIANEKQVLQIAKEILKAKPTSYKVLLKLALMFLRTKVSDERLLAKKCLDAVNEIIPDSPTYLHYTAMLYEQSGDYKETIKYFKKAADCNNFVAELSYVQYGWETGELEPLPYLLQMLEKYKHSIKEKQIAMLLAIAVTYYSLHKDIKNAAEYFLKALTIDPLNKKFKIYYKFLDFQTKNISLFLDNFCVCHIQNYPEICQKIRTLLNIKNVMDLTEGFQIFSMDTKKEQSNTDTN